MKEIPKSPHLIKMKQKRRKRFVYLSIIFFILIIIIIISAGYFSSDHRVTINNIEINGTKIIDPEDIEQIIKKNLEGKYFFIFSKSNFLVFPHQKIYNDLIKEFPRIKNLSITKRGTNTIRIEITERAGSYLYCGAIIPEVKTDIGENCYFVNDDGYIFDKAPYFSGDVYFKYYLSLSGKENSPLGEQMMKEDRFHKVTRFVDGVRSIGFDPIYLVIEKDNLESLFIKTNSIPHEIIFKEEDDLGVILGNLKVAMEQKEFSDEINKKYDKLEYIDLRFKNKVLYKFE